MLKICLELQESVPKPNVSMEAKVVPFRHASRCLTPVMIILYLDHFPSIEHYTVTMDSHITINDIDGTQIDLDESTDLETSIK